VRVGTPGGEDVAGLGGPAEGHTVQADPAEGEPWVAGVDHAAVLADVGQQAVGLVADGRGVFLPGAGGEVLYPAAEVVQDARAPLEMVNRADAVRVRPVAGGAVVAGGDGDVVAGEDDLSRVAVQEPVGEVAADGIWRAEYWNVMFVVIIRNLGSLGSF